MRRAHAARLAPKTHDSIHIRRQKQSTFVSTRNLKLRCACLCAMMERDGARVARPGVVSAPRLLHELTSSTDDHLAERQGVAPLQPLGRHAYTLALARGETALAPGAPRARRLPASTRVPPQCHIWCGGHAWRRQRGQLGHAGADLLQTHIGASHSMWSPMETLRTRALQTRCQAPR